MSKSTLAKLLATENLRVEYRNVQTASFNLKDRIVTLPVWNDTTPEIEDLLIGHETAHAIETPIDYIEAGNEMPSGFRSFLNVIEDARIERLMKGRYPGLRKSFSKGYAQFMERDFFELKDKDINKMLLIDRINVYFKVGPMFPVEFTSEEKVFVNRIDACTTFDEVKQIATDLFGYCQKELEDKKEQDQQEFQERLASGEFDDMQESEGGEANNMNLGDEWEDAEDGDGDQSDFADEDNGWSHEGSESPEYQPSKELKDYDELKSATDENLEKSIKGLSEQKEIYVGKLPDGCQYDFSKLIVNYKKIKVFKENIDTNYSDEFAANYNPKAYLEFEFKNKNAIAYLVKEFEMKKRAAELRRVVVSDTGMIDTNKLHTYKFNDDIFRKVGNVAAGKNHGIVFFLDWSGSMSDNLSGTLEQLITLLTFCRKVNIPFEVYAFSTAWKEKSSEFIPVSPKKAGHIVVDNYFALLNLFSSRMTSNEFRKMATDLLNFAVMRMVYTLGSATINPKMNLGGTPLNQTILAAIKIVPKYQKQNRLEVIDVVFLTDGEDSSSETVTRETSTEECQYGNYYHIDKSTRYAVSYVEDPETGKKYRVSENGVTETFLKILKDKTGCNLLGFYILSKNRKNFLWTLSAFGTVPSEESFKFFKNEKFYEVTSYGYDKYFLIPGGADLSTDDESLDDIIGDKDVSGRKLKTAFLKMNRNRLTNRVLLSKTIDGLV
jgi:hypothetical protein